MIKAITGSNLRRDSQKDGDDQAPTRTRLKLLQIIDPLTWLGLVVPLIGWPEPVGWTGLNYFIGNGYVCESLTRSKREKSKTGKIDEHIDAAGIDNMESFIDPSTNLIYYKLKILGKGGFAKGKFYH